MKVAVVTPHQTPYRDPFWNQVAQQPGIELDVFYCAGVSGERPWELSWETHYKSETLKGITIGPNGASYFNPAIWNRLKAKPYDAIIVGGYNHITMLMAIVYARLHRIPYFVMSEVYLAQPRMLWRKVVKYPVVRWVMRNAKGGFPTGKLATEYLVHYGMNDEYMSCVPNVPDVDAVWEEHEKLAATRDARRAEKELEGPVVLFVGRLIALKQVDTLILACKEVFADTPGTLLVLGDGPMRAEWEALAAESGLGDRVRFPGFIQPAELPPWYSLADLFVLPSSDETWGAVVVEAVAAGIPSVVADLVGCYADVINDPVVGTVVKAKSVDELAAAIRRHLRNPVTREDVRKAWEPVRTRMRHTVLAANMAATLRRATGKED